MGKPRRLAPGGGWVYAEGGTGAFLENGFFVERPEQRALLGALGMGAVRRRGNHVDASCDVAAGAWPGSPALTLKGALWSLALKPPRSARVLARDALGDAMLLELGVGRGRLILSGTFPSHAYGEAPYEGFERLVTALVAASGAAPRWRLAGEPDLAGVSARAGRSGRNRLFFVLHLGSAKTVTVHPGERARGQVREWVTGRILPRAADGSVRLPLPETCHRVLEWRARA